MGYVKKRTAAGLVIIVFIVLLAAFYLDTGSDARELEQITDQSCSFENRCPDGYTCMDFPETDGPVCADRNAYEYYDCPVGTMMVTQETYPGKLLCSPHGVLGMLR